MGRRPLVDRDTALDLIVSQFWTTGYEATSIDDLLEVTGMHRASFYRTFGDKHQAFRVALSRYMQQVADETVLPALDGRGSPTRRLLRLLHQRLDTALGLAVSAPDSVDGSGPGCFVVNTALELAPREPETRAMVAGGLDAIRAAIGLLVQEAVEAGEADADIDVELAADHLFTLLQGTNVLARTGGERRHLRRLLAHAMRTALQPNALPA